MRKTLCICIMCVLMDHCNYCHAVLFKTDKRKKITIVNNIYNIQNKVWFRRHVTPSVLLYVYNIQYTHPPNEYKQHYIAKFLSIIYSADIRDFWYKKILITNKSTFFLHKIFWRFTFIVFKKCLNLVLV